MRVASRSHAARSTRGRRCAIEKRLDTRRKHHRLLRNSEAMRSTLGACESKHRKPTRGTSRRRGAAAGTRRERRLRPRKRTASDRQGREAASAVSSSSGMHTSVSECRKPGRIEPVA
jgi:hypothetical protein